MSAKVSYEIPQEARIDFKRLTYEIKITRVFYPTFFDTRRCRELNFSV